MQSPTTNTPPAGTSANATDTRTCWTQTNVRTYDQKTQIRVVKLIQRTKIWFSGFHSFPVVD